jgi:hypothetical protein
MFRAFSAALLTALFTAAFFASSVEAQPISRDPNVRMAETYLKKVLAANGASAPVPSPNAAEKAALEALRANVNDKDELEIVNWPNTPLKTLKTVGQLNGLVGQLSNTGIYKTKAEQNARDAARNEQIAAVKTRSESLQETGALAKVVRITASNDQQLAMRRLGWTLNAQNAIEVGGKTFELGEAKAEELVELSEPGKKKIGSAYSKGAEAVEKKLADPKLGFNERTRLEEAKKARDAMIAETNELLADFRQKQIALDRAAATPAPPPPAKKK